MDDHAYNGRAMYAPNVRLKMGERELNFTIEDLLVSVKHVLKA